MTDDRFEDLLREAGREYHRPPATPREEMWQRIVAARAAAARRPQFNKYQNAAWWVWGAGIAALFVLGVGLGRLSRGLPRGGDVASQAAVTSDDRQGGDAAYRIATVEHLSQAETFLTLFRASVTQGVGGRGSERQVLAAASARQLLATNRLLIDSPAAEDLRLRLLLEDLELVLAQISQLAPRSRAEDLRLITKRIDRTAVMSRLRTEVPAGPGAAAAGGAL